MSATSSDAESSCGWTIISNEGSDIETLGSEAVVEYGAEALERLPVEEAELQEAQASKPGGKDYECVEEQASLHDSLGGQTLDETLCPSEAGGKEHVLSFSDHSDIVTLGDLREEGHGGAEVQTITTISAAEELYLGSSCSSQYTFTAAEPGLLLSHWKLPQSLVNLSYHLRCQLTGGRSFSAFSAPQQAVANSSSSEDEAGPSTSPAIRRRRLRKNTTSLMTDEEEELMQESPPSEEEDIREQRQHQDEEKTDVRPNSICVKSRLRSIFITSVFLLLLIAFCLGFSHFYGAAFHEPEEVQYVCVHGFEYEPEDNIDDLRERIAELKRHNLEFLRRARQTQAQNDELQKLLKEQRMEERINMVPEQQRLSEENEQLKKSLEHKEKSLVTLREELRNLRSQIKVLEEIGAGADLLLSENQRLKEHLEAEKQMNRDLMSQREDTLAGAEALRKKLETERKVTDELRKELARLRSRVSGARRGANSEAEELQLRLMELEKRLSFEQQRSDLWERLYVETKEDRAKGDTEPKVEKTKRGVTGKIKETFDAVKNSTKEFVHHHKEQIKKAKEAVKENLRKFSDSVKSTFRNFKDSASTFIHQAQGFQDKNRNKKDPRESWQHRPHKHHDRHRSESFHSSHNTRKSGGKVHDHGGDNDHKDGLNGCSGVFDCAYQESMSLFNTAMEPIRADEFHQLLRSYLQQEIEHFHHWRELETFIKNYFHNGVFIHDQMLFTDFVNGVEEYLAEMHEYHSLDDHVFGDLDDYVYRHFFGEAYARNYGPSRPFERPNTASKEESKVKNQQRKQQQQQRARSRGQSERKWSRSGKNTDRQMADVKIELGPMPFDPKY